MTNLQTYSKSQLNVLVALRMLIGWHLLYEGISKLWSSGWSAAGYLMDSNWLLGGLFKWMAGNETMLAMIDVVTVWGLIIVGLGLLLGFYSRYAAIGGIALVSLFYLSHPPLLNTSYVMPAEGSSFIVNKNLIEIAGLAVVLLFPSSQIIGLDGLLAKMRAGTESEVAAEVPSHETEPIA